MTSVNEDPLNRLRYRRQFVFGPRAVTLEGLWKTQRVGANWILTAQQDLPFLCAQTAQAVQLLLLGFIIDPEHPTLGDKALLERLAQCADWESVLRAVPKNKVSHSKKRSRQMAGKALKDVNHLCKCPGCGETKRTHRLCQTCLEGEATKRPNIIGLAMQC